MKDLNLNTSSVLPTSAGSTEGASGGALGGASKADLERGFIPERDDHKSAGDGDSYMPMVDPGPPQHGFLDRPCGWER